MGRRTGVIEKILGFGVYLEGGCIFCSIEESRVIICTQWFWDAVLLVVLVHKAGFRQG